MVEIVCGVIHSGNRLSPYGGSRLHAGQRNDCPRRSELLLYEPCPFINRLWDEAFVQPMSRRGSCWGNAPQKSLFGHMKDEIADLLPKCTTCDDVAALTDDWMDYYTATTTGVSGIFPS